jgi:hypothetical protein
VGNAYKRVRQTQEAIFYYVFNLTNPDIVYMAQVEINFDDERDKLKLFSVLKNLRGAHTITIEKTKQSRSLAQNRYYWGVIIPMLSSEFGYFKDEMHELLRRKFLSYTKANPYTGEAEMFARSTTKLNTADMEIYLESIRAWALSEFAVYLPLPNEFIGDVQYG